MNTNIMDSPITSLKPGRTLSMTHERHGRACDGRDLSVKFNLAEKVKSDPRAGGIGGRGPLPLKILADQLTLLQLEGKQIVPTTLLPPSPSDLDIFLRP